MTIDVPSGAALSFINKKPTSPNMSAAALKAQSAKNGQKTDFVLGDVGVFAKDRFKSTVSTNFIDLLPLERANKKKPPAGLGTGRHSTSTTLQTRFRDNIRFDDFSENSCQDRLSSVTASQYGGEDKIEKTISTYVRYKSEALEISRRARLDRVAQISHDASEQGNSKNPYLTSTQETYTPKMALALDNNSGGEFLSPSSGASAAAANRNAQVSSKELSNIPLGDREKQCLTVSEAKVSFTTHPASEYKRPHRHEAKKNANILPPKTINLFESFDDMYITTNRKHHNGSQEAFGPSSVPSSPTSYSTPRGLVTVTRSGNKSSVAFGEQVRTNATLAESSRTVKQHDFQMPPAEFYAESPKSREIKHIGSLGVQCAINPEFLQYDPSSTHKAYTTSHDVEFKPLLQEEYKELAKDSHDFAVKVKQNMKSSNIPTGDQHTYHFGSFKSTARDSYPKYENVVKPPLINPVQSQVSPNFPLGDESALLGETGADLKTILKERYSTTTATSFIPLHVPKATAKRYAYARRHYTTAFAQMLDTDRYPMKDNTTTEKSDFKPPNDCTNNPALLERAKRFVPPVTERQIIFPMHNDGGKLDVYYSTNHSSDYKMREGLTDVLPPPVKKSSASSWMF